MRLLNLSIGAPVPVFCVGIETKNNRPLPSVKLGYEIHREIALNVRRLPMLDPRCGVVVCPVRTLTIKPLPIVKLRLVQLLKYPLCAIPYQKTRFAMPKAPMEGANKSALIIENGSAERWFPRGSQAWFLTSGAFLKAYTNDKSFVLAVESPSMVEKHLPPQPQQVSEECVFLGMMGPKDALETA